VLPLLVLPRLQVVRALLVLTRLVVLPRQVVVVVLRAVRLVVEVVPRVLPVELLRSPSFSAVTARTTR
jgi:hypothetical protein